MGYSTQFKGQLTFTQPLTPDQRAALASMFDEDCRDHLEWEAAQLGYIDLQFTPDGSGIEWNGAEKTYHLDQLVNVVLTQMRKSWPAFGLLGTLIAQGEDLDDRWALTIRDDGWAHKLAVAPTGQTVTCPHCQGSFSLEGAQA